MTLIRLPHDRRLACEQLEDRRMLSIIAWTNRGTGPGAGDTDGFNALFGAQANLARQHVDRAIRDWQNVIVDFNYDGDNNPGTNNTLNLTVNTGNLGTRIAAGGPTTVVGGLPTAGAITVHNNAATHWLDPSPNDDSEFGANTANLFTGFATGISGFDLYTTMGHELGHVVGFTIDNANLAIANFLTTTTIDDPNTATAGNLVAFNVGGGAIEATFTAADTGHLWEGPATTATASAGLPIHVNALMNPGRAILANERNLISNTEAFILRDAFGYQIALPQDNMAITRNDATGGVTVRGQAGQAFNSLEIGASATPGFIEFKINQNVELVPFAGTTAITVDLGAGNDTVALRPIAASVPVTLTDSGPSSTDELQIHGGVGYDNIVVNNPDFTSTGINGKLFGGFETLAIFPGEGDADVSLPNVLPFASARITDGGSGAQTINVHQLSLSTPLSIGLGFGQNTVNLAPGGSANAIRSSVTIQGGPNADVVQLAPSAPSDLFVVPAPITFFGNGGDDTLIVGSGNLDAISGLVNYDGGGQSDALILDDDAHPLFVDYTITDSTVTRSSSFGFPGVNYSRVLNLQLDASQGPNTINFSAFNLFGATINGNGSNDNFVVGNGNNLAGGIGNFIGNGGDGHDTLTLNDALSTHNGQWGISGAGTDAPGKVFLGLQEFSTAGVEAVSILAGLGNNPVRFVGTMVLDVSVHGGGGDDTFTFVDASSFRDFFDQDENPPFNYAIAIDGGGGFNSLTVDDDEGFGRNYNVSSDRLTALDGGPLGLDFSYDNINSMSVLGGLFGNTFFVTGTSPDIPTTHQTSLIGGPDQDIFTIRPRDAAGNLTLASILGLGGRGGALDRAIVDDSASTLPLHYRFENFFGPSTTHIEGLGAGFGVGNDVEAIEVLAGAGDDVFELFSFQADSSLTIHAGDGVDKFDVAPTAKSLTADVMGMSSFKFDGGPTGYDSFSLFNENNPDPWTFTRTAAGIVTHNVATGKTTVWNLPNSEYLNAYGGLQADTFLIEETPTTGPTYNSFLGGGGNDNYIVGKNGRTNLITANIAIVNDAGVDSATIDNSADTTPRIAHVTEFFVAAAVGDDLFGPGGYLYHVNLAGSMTVKMGAGADTVYASPNVSTTVRLEGGNPSTAPGDFLGLGFGNVTSPLFTPLPLGVSRYTFGNASPVEYVGFEQATIDAVIPTVASQAYSETGPAPAITVQFSERVFDTPVPVHPYYLEIVNTETSQRIPFENVAVAYNVLTNVATFTFPGYASGRPPAGDYLARMLGGPTDSYGNAMGVQPAFSFAATAPGVGDFNGDGTVGGADLAVWKAGMGVSAAGDGDNDGDTDGNDFLVWQRRLGQTAAAPAVQPLAAAAKTARPFWMAIDEAVSELARGPYRPAERRIQPLVAAAISDVQPRREASRVEQRLDWAQIVPRPTSNSAAIGPARRAALEAAFGDLLDDTGA